MNTCFCMGHRDTPDGLRQALSEAVEYHITAYGVTEFVAGAYGRFDALTAHVVGEAKKRHPEIRLTYLRPYHPAERPDTPPGFDGSFYPPGMEKVPRRLAIVRANRYMVDNSQYLLTYAWEIGSNTKKILEYAVLRQKKGLIHIENLAEQVGRMV